MLSLGRDRRFKGSQLAWQQAISLFQRVDAMKHPIEMVFDGGGAVTRSVPQRRLIFDDEVPSACRYDSSIPELANNACNKGAADPQHLCKLLLSHVNLCAARPGSGSQQPLCCALRDGVFCIACCGLKNLGQ